MSTGLEDLIASRVAQVLALAVRKMAAHEAWVAASAAEHVGKRIAITLPILGRSLRVCWMVDDALILIDNTVDSTPATVQLSVSPAIYSQLGVPPFDFQSLMRYVQISGDVALAEWVSRLVQQLRPEVWEDLSQVIGDVPTYYVQRGVRTAWGHFKNTLSAVTLYAQKTMLDDEGPLLVRHSTLDALADRSQQLRYAVDRLAQRIERLNSGKSS